ncbi:MAG: hypothetical protein Q9P44_21085 [Anaerolineae bacterium]|nr:hypothetical protein [Anaerolineae bacterium]
MIGGSSMRHKKILLTSLVLFLMILPTFGQSTMETPVAEATEVVAAIEVERGVIEVESAFIRVLPDRQSEAVASVFERDILEIIGRNLDGLWFEVRRPNRLFRLGWISAKLIDIDFPPETLPMTDFTTGLVGTTPIPEDHLAIYLTAEANLRVEPLLSADIVAVVALGAILPAIGRDATGGWLYVNYRGTEGWLNSTVFRRLANILDLPDLTFVEENVAQLDAFIIPPDIQLGQLQAFRNFVAASKSVAASPVPLWENVLLGEVMPCEPPDFVQEYLITAADVQQLPELNRYAPRYNQGVILLNEAINPLYECGVLQNEVVLEARNDAINANIIMGAALGQLDFLENLIRDTNNLDPLTTATESP